MRAIILIFAAAALGPTGVGGCTEQPQSLASADQPGSKTDSWDEQSASGRCARASRAASTTSASRTEFKAKLPA